MLFNAKSSPQSEIGLSGGRISLPYIFHQSSHVFLAFLLIMVPTTNADSNFDPCSTLSSKSCFCAAGKVICDDVRMSTFPRKFPKDTNSLQIRGTHFANPILLRENISYLGELERLLLKNCNIKQLEPGVFSNLKKLTFLDLSGNKLTVIKSYTFRYLNLNFLILTGNKGIRFTRDAFFGMNVRRLVLTNTETQELDYKTFVPINRTLIGLWLDNNRITSLDPRFERLCSHLQIFDVSKNPLRCGCQIRWLVSYVKRVFDESKKSAERLTNFVSPKCSTPMRLHGRPIHELLPHDLVCSPPQMRNVGVLMEDKRRTRLACKVDGYPTPTVTWSRIYPRLKFIQAFPPPEMHYEANGRYTNRAEIVVTNSKSYEEYACIAENEGGKTNLTVRLRWQDIGTVQPNTGVSGVAGTESGSGSSLPGSGRVEPQRPVDRGAVDSTGVRGTDRDRGTERDGDRRNSVNTPQFNMPDEVTEQNYFFRKQFTLLELIGAVVGTFTGTLALFVLIYRFINCTKKKEKKRTFSQYMYESAYSGSHEYDVPRIDHHGPPYGPPPKPPGADGMEFLDYKTHRKLYNHV